MPFKKSKKNSLILGLILALTLMTAFSCAPTKKAAKKKRPSRREKAAKPAVEKPQVFFREGTEAKEGKVAPAILAPTVKGRIVNTTNCEGRIIMLNFWSIRCGPCVKEMPYLEDLYMEFKTLGLEIFSINTDQAPADTVAEFIESKPFDITYDVIADPDLVLTTVFTEWFVPVTIIIDSKGVLRLKNTGFTKRDYKKYRKFVKGLLNENKK